MCGRFDLYSSIEIIAKIFQIDSATFTIKPSYNVALSQNISIVINDGKKNDLIASRWGFQPSWAKEKQIAYSMINARTETVDTNLSYKDAFLKMPRSLLQGSSCEVIQ